LDFEAKDSDSVEGMPFLTFENFQKIPSPAWNYELIDDGWVWQVPQPTLNRMRISRLQHLPLMLFVGLFGLGMLVFVVFSLIKLVNAEFATSADFIWQLGFILFFSLVFGLSALWVALKSVKRILEPLVCSIYAKPNDQQIILEGSRRFWSFRRTPLAKISTSEISKIKLEKNVAMRDEFAVYLALTNGKRIYLSVYNMRKEEALFLKTVLQHEFPKLI
jgi:hypothetical protein